MIPTNEELTVLSGGMHSAKFEMSMYGIMSRLGERSIPIGIAGVVGLAIITFGDANLASHVLSKHIPVATMTFGVVISGFTATQRSMMLGMRASRVLHFAATTGYYRAVNVYLTEGILAGLLVAAVSFVAVLLEGICDTYWHGWTGIWSGSVIWTIGVLVRNEVLMYRLFKRFLEEQKSSRQPPTMIRRGPDPTGKSPD